MFSCGSDREGVPTGRLVVDLSSLVSVEAQRKQVNYNSKIDGIILLWGTSELATAPGPW